jgi:uncharacterized protein YjbJ (UPF0337 family)
MTRADPRMERVMDENRLSGTAKELGGKVQESAGRVTGNAGMQLRGQMRQAEGRTEKAAAEGAEAMREFSGSIEDSLRNYIESKPYTTAAIALALGWLIGRSHRPF